MTREELLQHFREKKDGPKLGEDTRSEFRKGLSSSIDQLQGTGYGLVGLVGDAIGSDKIRDFGMEGYRRNEEEAQKNAPRVGRVEDWESFGDVVDWAAGGLGQIIPSVATVVAGGGIGGYIAKKGAEKAVKNLTKEAIKKRVMIGQTAGAIGTSSAIATGSIYGGADTEGAKVIGMSLAGGAASGALDALPILRLGKAFGFGGELKEKIVGKLHERIIKGGLEQAPIEAGTEALQTLIEEATKGFITEKGLPEDIGSQLLNAAALGTLGGTVMGGATAAITGEAPPPPGPLEQAVNDIGAVVNPSKNPITGEKYGNATMAKYGEQLANIDARIKANPTGPIARRLKEQAAEILDEIEVDYLTPQKDKDGKEVTRKPTEQREAKDIMAFYKDYIGANAQEIAGVAPETNDQRIKRIMEEDEARIGKAQRDTGTPAVGPQPISPEEQAAYDAEQAKLNQQLMQEVEEEQILEVQAKELSAEIEKKAQQTVKPTVVTKQVKDDIKQPKANVQVPSETRAPSPTPDVVQKTTERVVEDAKAKQVGLPPAPVEPKAPEATKATEEVRPRGPLFHTLRNIEDVDAVLKEGLKPGSNVGTQSSQAIGMGGVTFEYNEGDLDITPKQYRADSEGIINTQKVVTPKRIWIDISDVNERQGSLGATHYMDEVEQLVDAGTDLDAMWTDLGGLIYEIEERSYKGKAEAYKKLEKEYGKDLVDYIKENEEGFAYAVSHADQDDGVSAGFTVDDYVRGIMDKLPDGIPVFTYEIDEDGRMTSPTPVTVSPEVPKVETSQAPQVAKEVIEKVAVENKRQEPEVEKAEAIAVQKRIEPEVKDILQKPQRLLIDGVKKIIMETRDEDAVYRFIHGFAKRANDPSLLDIQNEIVDLAILELERGVQEKQVIEKKKVETEARVQEAAKGITDEDAALNLNSLPATALKKVLVGKGVKGYNSFKKPELIQAIKDRLGDPEVSQRVKEQLAARGEKKTATKEAAEKREALKKERKEKLTAKRRDREEQLDLEDLEGEDPIEQARREEERLARQAERKAMTVEEVADELLSPTVTEVKAVKGFDKDGNPIEEDLSPEELKKLEQQRLERELMESAKEEGIFDDDMDLGDDYGYSNDFFPDDDGSRFGQYDPRPTKTKEERTKEFNKRVYDYLTALPTAFDSKGNFLSRRDTEFHKIHSRSMEALEKAFNEMISTISFMPPNVKFVFAKELSTIDGAVLRDKRFFMPAKNANVGHLKFRGLHVSGQRVGEPTTIYMNPNQFIFEVYTGLVKPKDMVTAFKKTFLHEFVGHYGLRRLFASNQYIRGEYSKYDQFLDQIIATNEEAFQGALALAQRWKNHINLDKGSDIKSYTIKNAVDGTPLTLSISAESRRALMDEYLAETAKEFLDPAVRAKWSKGKKSLVNRFLTWVKHKLRIFMKQDPISNEDLMAMVANSYENLYGKGVAVPTAARDKKLKMKRDLGKDPQEGVDYVEMHVDPAETYANAELPKKTQAEAKSEEHAALRQAAKDGLSVKDILATEAVRATGYGKIRQNAVNDFGAKMWQKFRDKFPGMYTFWNPEGTLRNYEMKDAEAMKALGKMGEAFRLAKEAGKVLKNLSNAQAEAVMEYFTDARGDVNNINLPEDQKRKLEVYKETIMDFGDRLVRLGLLDPDAHYENRGKYLPARYLAYMQRATGQGRKASPMTYLLKKGELTHDEKVVLGELKDPMFVLPETISLIGRDVALMEYTETIRRLSSEKDLGWILGDNSVDRGDGKAVSVTTAEDMIEVWNEIIDDYERSGNARFNSSEMDITELKAKRAFVDNQIQQFKDKLETRIRSEANLPLDQPLPTDEFKNAVGAMYKKMPNERGYGALRGQWVRKEIYDEFVETTMIQKELTGLSKAMAPGGIIDRGNQLWKMMKVPFNAPSWVRNSIGNMVLLDIASPTNILSLGKMMTEEVSRALKGDPSEYYQLAHSRGLFGTTYSSNEIFLLSEINSATRAAKLAKDLREVDDFYKSGFMKAKGYFMLASEIASQGYGNLEGIFKTVAMRDYIERWRKENGVESLKDLAPEQREAVINESVIAANKAVFDYSSLTAWQKDIRRNALGAPFLTYTLKAGPAVVRGLASNPQKFIKYLALPYAIGAAAMMSLGDVTPEEIDEWEKNQPKWMKEKSSVYVMPWRDSNGKLVPVDFGYFFPWAPWQDLAIQGVSKYKTADGIEDYAFASGEAVLGGAKSLGLLGGPLPTVMSALLTNKETFLGREIVSEGDSSAVKLAKVLNWTYTLAAPPFLTNDGVAGKLMDHYDVSLTGLPNKNVDAFGEQKAGLGSTLLRGVGVSTFPQSIEEAKLSKLKDYNRQLKDLQIAKSKALKNLGWSREQRIQEIQDINRRILHLKRNFTL